MLLLDRAKAMTLMSVACFGLVACQSAPPPQPTRVIYAPTQTMQRPPQLPPRDRSTPPPVSRPSYTVPVVASKDGVQDIPWKIATINGQRAQFFTQAPYLLLQSSLKRVSGHTGCNQMTGTYQLNGMRLALKTDAAHQSCDNALAQEADLMDALSRVRNIKIQGQSLYLLDDNQNILIQMQR